MAAKTDWSADEGETETVPVSAAILGVVSNNALPSEYIHIWKHRNSMWSLPRNAVQEIKGENWILYSFAGYTRLS